MFTENKYIDPQMTDKNGVCRLSALLTLSQDAAGEHCKKLGLDWDSLWEKGLFWAVIRTRVEISALPLESQQVTVQTWPLPSTRSAYPRATAILDNQGRVLAKVYSLWVLMDRQSRKMILPGKSGIRVPEEELRGTEITPPGSLPPAEGDELCLHRVHTGDLDQNGHVNNARYVRWVEENLAEAPKAFTVCYFTESRLGDTLRLTAARNELGQTQVDFFRTEGRNMEENARICAVKLEF